MELNIKHLTVKNKLYHNGDKTLFLEYDAASNLVRGYAVEYWVDKFNYFHNFKTIEGALGFYNSLDCNYI